MFEICGQKHLLTCIFVRSRATVQVNYLGDLANTTRRQRRRENGVEMAWQHPHTRKYDAIYTPFSRRL